MLIFEVVNGYPPFYDDDKVTMYKNITELRYHLTRRMSKARAAAGPGHGRVQGSTAVQGRGEQ